MMTLSLRYLLLIVKYIIDLKWWDSMNLLFNIIIRQKTKTLRWKMNFLKNWYACLLHVIMNIRKFFWEPFKDNIHSINLEDYENKLDKNYHSFQTSEMMTLYIWKRLQFEQNRISNLIDVIGNYSPNIKNIGSL